MFVTVAFDVEDLVHPDSDDVARDIADVLADDGLVASLCVVGEKARLWERRGRRDAIAAAAKHDVGLHTNMHSIHPTVSEYLADKGWADGVAEAQRREGSGAQDIARIFGAYPAYWGTPGSSWAPQIPGATRLLGIAANIYSHAILEPAGACWFAGQLCYASGIHLHGLEDCYGNDAAFEAQRPALLAEVERLAESGASSLNLFGGHPTRFRYTQFWDATNFSRGQNTAPQDYRPAPRKDDSTYATGLRNLRALLDSVRRLPGVTMTSVRALNHRYALENGPLGWQPVLSLAQSVADSDTIRTDDPVASPAQALDVFARALLRLDGGAPPPAHLMLRTVRGPTAAPAALTAPLSLPQAEVTALCRALVAAVDATGHLPTALSAGGVPVGPGPLLKVLAAALVGAARGVAPDRLSVRPGAEEPAVAAALVENLYGALPGWPPHVADLRLDLLALHTRLQSWSLKPAVLAS